MSVPSPGLTVEATVVRVKDGDTIRVKVEREFDLRLIHPNDSKLEFNTPELDTPEGKQVKEYLSQLEGQKVTVFIPANKSGELLDFNSFSRVLGMMWTGTGELLTQRLLDLGVAKLFKRGSY